MNVNTQAIYDLGPAWGQRPFAIGEGLCAHLISGNTAAIRSLDSPHAVSRHHTFPDNVPTGLSHISNSVPVSWDSQRNNHEWGLNFTRSGPVEFAQSFNDDGVIGRLDGVTDHEFSVWRDSLVNDQRVSFNGDNECALIGWVPDQPARLAVVVRSDMVPISTSIPPITGINRKVWMGSFDRYNNGSFPGNCWLDDKTNPNHVEDHATGEWLYYYTAGDPDGDADSIERKVREIQDRIDLGELAPLPVIAYVPHGVRLPANADVIGVECYWKKPLGETLAQFEQSRRNKVVEANRPVALITQTYFSNANNAGHLDSNRHEIQQIAPVISSIAHDYESVKIILGFSAGDWRGTGYDDPALHSLIAPQYEAIAESIEDPDVEETGMRVVLHSYDPECNRSDPHGHGIDFEIEEPPTPCHVTVGLDDGEEPMGFTIWTTRKNGHYFRGIRHKPGVNGDHPVVIQVLDAPNLSARVLTETRSDGTVRVYSPF
jgi:hypothetical protein